MPNDAKLGLVVGLGLVIAVAILFVRKDYTPAGPTGSHHRAAASEPSAPDGLPADRSAEGGPGAPPRRVAQGQEPGADPDDLSSGRPSVGGDEPVRGQAGGNE